MAGTQNSVNVEKILAEIRKEIEKAGYNNDVPHFQQVVKVSDTQAVSKSERAPMNFASEVDLSKASAREVAYLRTHSYVEVHRPIHSHRKITGRIIVLIKKILRTMTKFYVQPIANDQNDYNAHVAIALELICDELVEKDREIERLNKLLDSFNNKC